MTTMSTDPKVFDKRLVERLLKSGEMTAQDYERHLASLPDLAEQAAPVEARLEAQVFEAKGHHSEED
ncbi:MAG: hypothetical protein LBM75_11690 [Myxococcales bacterium]|jgi:hypothetical protein|nr:hypothetical protein [Myxococcales bacterium]